MELIIGTGTVVAASRDTMPATGTPGWATDGDPAASIPATDFPASHYNMLVAEVVQVILGAGLTLDRTNWGQLLTAINALIAVAGNSSAANLAAEAAARANADAELQAGKQDVLGYTPVQQGGGPNQTTDKITLGQDTTYGGLVRLAIGCADQGTLLSGTYGASIDGLTNDLPGFGLWYQRSTQRPAFAFQDPTGAITIIDIATEPEVVALQSSLAGESATRADQVATLTADISDCVSGTYGKSASDYQILGFYFQASGHAIVVYNDANGDTVYNGIANFTDVATLQTNLTATIASQADINSGFSTALAAKVGTNASNDGTNSPVTLLNWFDSTGMPWISGPGFSTSLVKTSPAANYYQIMNLVMGDDHYLNVQDSTGSYRYAPSSAQHVEGSYDTYVIDGVRTLSFTTTSYDEDVVNFPIAFSDVPSSVVITSSEAQNGLGESVSANVFKGTITKTGFTPHLSSSGGDTGTAIPSTQPVTISVIAIGPA